MVKNLQMRKMICFWDFLSELDYEREDDWWTDRKGGYDVTYSYVVDENK